MISEDCKVVCVVHNLQVLSERIDRLMQVYDKRVDYIITPTSVIWVEEEI